MKVKDLTLSDNQNLYLNAISGDEVTTETTTYGSVKERYPEWKVVSYSDSDDGMTLVIEEPTGEPYKE